MTCSVTEEAGGVITVRCGKTYKRSRGHNPYRTSPPEVTAWAGKVTCADCGGSKAPEPTARERARAALASLA